MTRPPTAIYGLYTAAVFMAALPGGWIADRLIGAQRAVMLGGALMTLGNLMLVMPGPKELFFGGLVVIILGVGLLKPNVSTLVARPLSRRRRPARCRLHDLLHGHQPGRVHRPVDRRLAGASVRLAHRLSRGCGGPAVRARAVLVVAAPVQWRGRTAQPQRRRRRAGAGLAPAVDRRCNWRARRRRRVLGQRALDPPRLAQGAAYVLVGMAALYFLYLFTGAGLDAVERRRMIVVLVMFIACALFWSGYEQAGSSLNLFAKRHIDRVVGGFEIPAGWFQSVQPAFVIIFAPFVLDALGATRTAPARPGRAAEVCVRLAAMGLGFLFMVAAANIVVGRRAIAAYLLILTYLLTFSASCA